MRGSEDTASRAQRMPSIISPISGNANLLRRGNVQRHLLLSVPGSLSSGTPTAIVGSHWNPWAPPAWQPTMSRDRTGHDGACKQRGRGDKRVRLRERRDGPDRASSIPFLLEEEKEQSILLSPGVTIIKPFKALVL